MLPDRVRIIAIYDNAVFSAPIEYTFGLFFSIYSIASQIIPFDKFKPGEYNPDETLAITYGKKYINCGLKKQIHIYASDFFGKNYLKPESMPETPVKKYHDLPVIFTGEGRFDGWVKQSPTLVETNIDIIASSFFMVSRYEEVISKTRDEHDRFPAAASLAYREGFLNRPVVNEYIELLWTWIKTLIPEFKRKPLWPDNKNFVFCLTHDVDSTRRFSWFPPIFEIRNAALRSKNIKLAFNISRAYLSSLLDEKKDPYNTFEYLLDIERVHGLKSTFYFMNKGNNYNTEEKNIIELIRQIEGKGCESGMHGGYFSYNNPEKMTQEKINLDKVISNNKYGCRQHFLRWKTPDTWQIQEKLGLLYDTTLSFADHAGFRCGICLPFKPFDVLKGRTLNIWELPLTLMEGSLQNQKYQNLSPDLAYKEITGLCDAVSKYNGVFVLLWHNSSFDTLGGWSGWKEVYENSLEYIGKQQMWNATGRDIISWWESEKIQ